MSKISDVAIKIGSGITPLKSNKEFWNSKDIPWLKTEQLGNYKIYDTQEYISQKALDKTNIKIFPKNTISVAMYGEGKTRGSVSILANDMTTNQACCNIVVDDKIADFRYVYYWLKNNYIQLRALSSGIRNNLNSDNIKNFEIDLKDLNIQKRIADILSNLDDKIENNNKIIEELESMAKTIYDYWFLQYEFPNEDGKPYKSSGGKMVYNKELKKEIPAGWRIGYLQDFIDKDKGGDWGKDFQEGNYNRRVVCIRGADFPSICGLEDVKAPTRYILEKNENKSLENGDLIIEISGGSPSQSTGRICYINSNTLKRFKLPIITSNFCKAISLKNKEKLYWFYIQWLKLYESNVFFKYEGKTTGIKNLLFDMLSTDYKIIEPSEDLIKKYNCKVSVFFDKIQKNKKENEELTELRDYLLPLLMNGQVCFKE